MKIIEFDKVVSTAEELCGRAACDLPPDVLARIAECAEKETSPHGREFFRQYLENGRRTEEGACICPADNVCLVYRAICCCGRRRRLYLCQDHQAAGGSSASHT